MTASLAAALQLAEHLGALHPVERVLVGVVAFGPFVVLAVVVYVVRRRDLRALDEEQGQEDVTRSGPPATPHRPGPPA